MLRSGNVIIFLLMLLWGCLPTPSHAELFKSFGVSDGLSNNSVKSITQDKQGFIWVGTFDGLCRFDGNQFKVFRDVLPDGEIIRQVESLLAVEEGLWVGTRSGLYFYSFDKREFNLCYHRKSTEENERIKGIADNIICAKGRIFFLVDDKLYVRSDGMLFETYMEDYIYNCMSMTLYGDHYLFILTRNGLYLVDTETNKVLDEYAFYDQDLNDHGLYYSKNENVFYLWHGLGYGIDAFKLNDNNRIEKVDKNYPVDVKTIIDYKDKTYFGTDGSGLIGMSDNIIIDEYTIGNNNISSNAIFSLFVDKDENLWVGTYHGGLNLYSRSLDWFNSLTFDNKQLYHKMVTSVCADDEYVFIGLDGGGLNVYDKKTKEVKSYTTANSSIGGNNVVTILQDGKDIWMGIYGKGLCRFSPETKTFKSFKVPSFNDKTDPNRICEIKDDGKGNIWIVGEDVVLFDKISGTFEPIKELNWIWACGILFDENNVWIASSGNGLYLLDGTTKKVINHYNDKSKDITLKNNGISYIFIDSNRDLWFSLEDGLYKIQKTGVVEHVLSGMLVYSILEDKEGYFWLGTNKGLYRYNVKENIVIRLGYDNNIPLTEFNLNACYDLNGVLYFGAIGGLVWFNSDDIVFQKDPKTVYFDNLELSNGDNIIIDLLSTNSKEIKLSYDQNFFNISFAVPEFLFPDMLDFLCYMKNFEKSWKSISNRREISYTNVPPGEYVFYVKSSNLNGYWDDSNSSLKIIITPPWWKTYWAILLWVFLFLSIVGAVLWLYLQRLNIKHLVQLKEMEKSAMKNVNEAKLNFFTNITHEFRTPIFLITASLEELMKEGKGPVKVPKSYLIAVYRNAIRLNKLISRIIDFRKLESGKLDLKLQRMDVVSFCKDLTNDYEALCRSKDITFYFLPSRTMILLDFDPEKLETIITNLVSNAFKYTPEGGHVFFSVKDQEDCVLFEVEDNGIGIDKEFHESIFDNFFQVEPSKASSKGDGIGLSFVKRLVELHGGEVKVESEMNLGSKFFFTIPKKGDENNESDETQLVIDDREMGKRMTTSYQSPVNLHTILIIDDEKETVEILERFLIKDFKILKAGNGIEGLVLAQEMLPDLIICDIMMPKMDGTEFLQMVKGDKKLSHIPVILFTAKVSEEDQMTAFSLGADAYLTKPISLRYLRNRIDHLLAKKETIDVMNSISVKEKTYTKEEQRFLLKCKEIIDDNLTSPDFSISFLTQQIGMSHSSLYRKIKDITGMTIIEFINDYRIFKAVQLFNDGETNISAVCVKCGFNDLKNFRELFKRKMKVSPKQYVKSL